MATMAPRLINKLYEEFSIKAVVEAPYDCKVLYVQRFFRFAAYGSTVLVLALFLKKLEFSEQRIGLFMTLTLLGDVAISLVLTIIADSIGRRRMLAFGAFSMACSGVVFALASSFWILLAAAVFGVISPSGNEIGPFRAIEESTLAHLTHRDDRTSILAWYTVFGFAGASVGILSCGWAVRSLQLRPGWDPLASYRMVFYVYAVLGLIKLLLCCFLTERCEFGKNSETDSQEPQPTAADETRPLLSQNGDQQTKDDVERKCSGLRSLLPQLSPESLSLVWKLCLLFGLDSLASGLSPASWMTYFFNTKFNLSEGKLGTIFFAASVISTVSNLVAASLAKRLGLIKTMVFTHVPASIALALIPIPDSVGVAVALLVFRASTNSMDQAPRQAFLASAVRPGERTAVMGISNVVKTLSQSIGPVVTGALAGRSLFWAAFVIAGALKLLYDFLILAMFLGYKTIEERAEDSTNSSTPIHENEVSNESAANGDVAANT